MMDYSNSADFNGNSVAFVIEDNTIEFTVNGQYDSNTSENKVAITRWLLKEWEKVKNSYDYLIASPHIDHIINRSSLYQKLGFNPVEGAILDEHIWFNPCLSEFEINNILEEILENIEEDEDGETISWEDFLASQ